ncbi:MAG: tyrosine-type recombinase/integrase [Oligoflexia bacterium]|nr:tyrosine-type recombinase/integrase [Oligoflexia bacterium]
MDKNFSSNVDGEISPKNVSQRPERERVTIDGVEYIRELKNGQLWVFDDERALGISVYQDTEQTSEKKSALFEFLLSSNSPETRRIYKIELKLFFEFLAEFKFPSDEKKLEKLHLIAYRDHLSKHNYAFKTIRRKISVVNSYFNYLEEKGLIPKNKCTLKTKELPKDQVVRPTNALTDEEALKILELSQNHHSDERVRIFHHAILSLFLASGMRVTELITLKRNSYQEVDGIYFLKILGKGGKIREVPLTNRSKQALDEYFLMMERHSRRIESGDPIFQPQSSNDPSDNLKRACSHLLIDKMIKKYCLLAGIKKRITPHSLRATTITHLREQEADIYAIAEMAGHASPETTKRYIKRADQLSRSAAFKSKF